MSFVNKNRCGSVVAGEFMGAPQVRISAVIARGTRHRVNPNRNRLHWPEPRVVDGKCRYDRVPAVPVLQVERVQVERMRRTQ